MRRIQAAEMCLQSGRRIHDGRSMHLWNAGILPQHYTASQPRRPQLETHRYENIKIRTEITDQYKKKKLSS
jgi:hypothetical protein